MQRQCRNGSRNRQRRRTSITVCRRSANCWNSSGRRREGFPIQAGRAATNGRRINPALETELDDARLICRKAGSDRARGPRALLSRDSRMELWMTIAATQSLFQELELAVSEGSSSRRVDMLRQITDLFLSDADRLNAAQVGV